MEEITHETKRIDFDTVQTRSEIEMNSNDLIKFNVNQTGVFIVNYDGRMWIDWIKELNNPNSTSWKKLSPQDRNNLLIDAFYLARSGRLSYRIALELAQFMKYERSFVVWSTAFNMLMYVRNFAISQDKGIAFNQWIQKEIIATLYDELGWDVKQEDDDNTKRLRALILNFACAANYQPCIESAKAKFEQFQADSDNHKRSTVYDPDTFNIFLSHTMRFERADNQTKYSFLIRMYSNAISTSTKMSYLKALASVEDKELLTDLIDKSLEENFLRAQDFFSFMSYIADNPQGLEIGWNFYRQNYDTLVERYFKNVFLRKNSVNSNLV